jgi:penicillin-binding protein 1C
VKRRLLRLLLTGAIVTASVVVALAVSATRELKTPPPSTLLLDRHGDYLGENPTTGDMLGFWPLPTTLPERVVIATLETEDRTFFEHAGVRPGAILRAAWQNVTSGRVVSGASTLPMQVARMQDPARRTLASKAREAVTALLLVYDHGHDEVLRHYLRIAPYGNRAHGIERAARMYFDKPLQDLSWLQASFLAGLPQAPGRMNPYDEDGLRRGMKRAHLILELLYLRGRIDLDTYELSRASDLGLVAKKTRDNDAMHATLMLSERAQGKDTPTVTATLDLGVQKTVAKALRRNLAGVAHRGATNSAALVVDLERGDVLAWVGATDYFNDDARGRIDYLRAKRSPGSTLKPFIYGLALDDDAYTAATELEDTPMDFITEGGRSYLPRNIGRSFLGPMLFREALGNSRNIPALRVLAKVGVEPTLRRLEAAGVESISYDPDAYGLGLALGNLHLTPVELARVYASLAEDGVARDFRYFEDDLRPEGVRIFKADTAQMLTNILDDPVARRPSFPTNGPLDYDFAVAVKTGTSQGYRDAWTAAFTDRLLVVVWVGNHDWSRMNRLGGMYGASFAAREIINRVTPLRAPHKELLERFPAPDGWEAKTVCALTGHVAGEHCPHAKAEHFRPGTAPWQTCEAHAEVLVDVRNGQRATAKCPKAFVASRVLLDLPARYRRWAEAMHLELAPQQDSPLCGPQRTEPPRVAITQPRDKVKFLFDPDTPEEFSTIRLAADVYPRDEEVVFLVDGAPVARTGYPHEVRWSLTPGRHKIEAAFVRRGEKSRPVRIRVVD